jgi:hypothetical protein
MGRLQEAGRRHFNGAPARCAGRQSAMGEGLAGDMAAQLVLGEEAAEGAHQVPPFSVAAAGGLLAEAWPHGELVWDAMGMVRAPTVFRRAGARGRAPEVASQARGRQQSRLHRAR